MRKIITYLLLTGLFTLTIKSQHVITLEDVEFDTSKGEITKYIGSDTDIIIPGSFSIKGSNMEILRIASSAFKNKDITNVKFSENVRYIGISAFEGNPIDHTTILLPHSIEHVGYYAFGKYGSFNIALPLYDSQGYIKEWKTQDNKTVKTIDTGLNLYNGTLKNELAIFTITYHTIGGSHTNQSSFNFETETFTLTEATKDNFSFSGWYSNEELNGDVITEIKKGTLGNIELWAKYKLDQELQSINLSVIKDARLLSGAPSQNFGNETIVDVYSYRDDWSSPKKNYRVASVLDFGDLDIPLDKIKTATLKLYHPKKSLHDNKGNNAFTVYACSRNWNESSVNWNNSPQKFTETKVNVPKTTGNLDYEIDVLPVLKSKSNGRITASFCLTINNISGTKSSANFASKEHSNVSMHPKLFIELDNTSTSLPMQEKIKCCLYPNPASNLLHIETYKAIGGWISIVDLKGKTVWSKQIDNSKQIINISNFKKGFYMVNITTNNNNVSKKLIIK